jgi:hypothetical protein
MAIPDFSRLPVTIRRWKFGKRRTIEISRDLVKVRETGLFASKWTEPVSAFKGILRRAKEEDRGEGGVVMVHFVELVHPDRKKTIRLYKADKEEGIRTLWKDAAHALHLTALDETSNKIVTSTPEDLDKSIRDLAAEGKISGYFDADRLPPKGIVWKKTEGELKITVRQEIQYSDVLKFIGGAFAILLVEMGWIPQGFFDFFVWWGGLFYMLSIGVPLFFDWIAKRHIVITPMELSYFRKIPFGIFRRKAISLGKLKNVRRRLGYRHAEVLIIESDTTIISIGRLGKQQLLWLEKFILSAIIIPPK